MRSTGRRNFVEWTNGGATGVSMAWLLPKSPRCPFELAPIRASPIKNRQYARVVKINGWFPFRGTVVWLTPEQGGRSTGPPPPTSDFDYAHTAFIPPLTADSGLASFVLRGFTAEAWRSPAEGRWLMVDNEGPYAVGPGTVLVCTEGARAVAYFHVAEVKEDPER